MASGKYQKWLEPEQLILLEGWARDGLTYEQIAHNAGISASTLREWSGKYPAISAALKKGREVADYEVENALFKRALGYWVEETVTDTDNDGHARERVVRKFVPPEPTALIYWLKNRRPDKWRDKPKDEDTRALNALDALLKEFRDATKQ